MRHATCGRQARQRGILNLRARANHSVREREEATIKKGKKEEQTSHEPSTVTLILTLTLNPNRVTLTQ